MKRFFISLFLLSIFYAACAPKPTQAHPTPDLESVVGTMMAATLIAIAPTAVVTPTNIPFVMPTGDFEMSWDIFNIEYFSTHCILTIQRQGSKYTEKLKCPDGSNGYYDLTVSSVGSKIKLKGHLGITTSLYGDYMVIDKDGWLFFYDDQGYIYGVPPIN